MAAESSRPTPLFPLHARLDARMVDFAGWRLPLQFAGMVSEHNRVRTGAGVFDVSHMCQFALTGSDRVANAERLLPVAAAELKPGRNKYTFMCNGQGGVIDDLVLGNDGERLFAVCNAARAGTVLAHVAANLQGDCALVQFPDQALLALQGPDAASIMAQLAPGADELFFMDSLHAQVAGAEVRICRCGYTGEDGFEISAAAADALPLAERLLAGGRAAPAGLGARDLLRLEAGLCLYGNELDERTNPVEAGLAWSIPARRRREGGFIGADALQAALAGGCRRKLVGLTVSGRLPLRRDVQLHAGDAVLGTVTSGGWSPTLERPVALAYVESAAAEPGTRLSALLRGRSIECQVASLPHVAHKYRIRPRKSSQSQKPQARKTI